MQYDVITTPRLIIRQFELSHISDEYISWLNDRNLMRYSEQRHKSHTRQTCEDYVRSFNLSSNFFGAIELDSGALIGSITAYYNKPNNIVDIGIMLGSYHGHGYGLEAWNGIINWIKDEFAPRKITAGTLSVNKPMLRLMEASGMVDDGMRKQQYEINGVAVDAIYKAIYLT